MTRLRKLSFHRALIVTFEESGKTKVSKAKRPLLSVYEPLRICLERTDRSRPPLGYGLPVFSRKVPAREIPCSGKNCTCGNFSAIRSSYEKRLNPWVISKASSASFLFSFLALK